jgi:hypothetical protein
MGGARQEILRREFIMTQIAQTRESLPTHLGRALFTAPLLDELEIEGDAYAVH